LQKGKTQSTHMHTHTTPQNKRKIGKGKAIGKTKSQGRTKQQEHERFEWLIIKCNALNGNFKAMSWK